MSMFRSDTLFAGFYWGPRRDDVKECANRLRLLLRRIADVDALFSNWHVIGTKLGKQPTRLAVSPHALENLIAGKWMRTETGGELVEDGGCHFMIDNGAAGLDDITISVSCGADCEGLTNSCVIYPPVAGAAANRILRVPVMIELGKVCVESWEPRSGVVVAHDLLEAVEPERKSETMPRVAEVGWLTYLSTDGRGSAGAIAPPSYVVPVGKLGHFIVAMTERPDPLNNEHVKILRKVLKHVRKRTSP